MFMFRRRITYYMVVVMSLSCMVLNNFFTTICYADTIETSDTLEDIGANDYVEISNDALELRVTKSNGKFILFDKRSNKIWYSNPNDTENDKISAGLAKSNIESQIVLEYLSSKDENTKTTTQTTNSFTMCAQNNGIEIEKNVNSIKVIYSFKEIGIVVPVIYSIDKTGYLEVTIDVKNIKENDEYLIVSMQLLPFFGAANSTEEGYLFIPDGCGAIAKFNQNIFPYKSYEKMVYGYDAVHKKSVDTSNDLNIYMPVFGTVYDNAALMGIITDGDGSASILAQTGNTKTFYNTIFSKLNYRVYSEEQALYANNKDKTISTLTHTSFGIDEYTIRYYSLFDNDASYSGMARAYRNYLINEKKMQKKNENDSSLYLKVYCNLEVKKNFLGIKYYKSVPLTTFNELQEIIMDLKDTGVSNLSIELVGWANNGVFNRKYVKDAKPLKVLGGQKAFNSLMKYCNKQGINVFPDVDFLTFEKSGNGVSISRNSAKSVNGEDAKQYKYSIVTYNKNLDINPWYLISPNYLIKNADKFLGNYKLSDCKNISVSSMGNTLFSDFKNKDGVFRSKSLKISEKLFDNLNKDYNVCTEEANAYCLSSVTNIISVPMHSSGYEIFAYDVPFYQMVIHGSISYSSTSAVQNSDIKTLLLKCLETGSDMMFECIAKDSFTLRETRLSDKFSIGYNSWNKQAIASYLEYSKVFSMVKGCAFKSHTQVLPDVYEAEYSNGIKIFVNYSNKDVVINGVQVSANGYGIKEAK